jgi:hydrogenase maturation protein HypF
MSLIRQRYNINGIVQGVGFRPFVYRLAHENGLSGWVRNSPAGVEIEVQGTDEKLAVFGQLISGNAPPLASISSITFEDITTSDDRSFSILPSAGGEPDIRIAPDSALCADCLQELFDPFNRRYRYPFITCTNCGPRYSIITGIPYDRPKTTMAGFQMCPDCLEEYHAPDNRRFHAQPIACQQCGPQVQLLAADGGLLAEKDEALLRAVEVLKTGHILAVKGIGGYHLAVDACNHETVERLRERKKRDEKPFAVMAANLATARLLALLYETEERLLVAPESPIIIARKSPDCHVSPLVAPNNGWLGLMLPYTPLHHLLIQGNFMALAMTSANVSDEPVAFEDDDALQRLGGIADFFLVHNRPIHIRSDDSVMRVFQHKPLFYRRARGYAPRAVKLPFEVAPILAVGAELKGAVCLAKADRAFLSQHIGDLQNSATCDAFSHTINHLTSILEISPRLVACDLHPDYLSSIHAAKSGLPVIRVQHHHAHMASCMAENGLDGKLIGIILDGAGYGSDGTIWGGEFLVGGYDGFQRHCHFRTVRLPGGDAAVREPWRMALAYLHQSIGNKAFSIDHPVAGYLTAAEQQIFATMLEKGLNAPLTSSCGRLFDAVSALLNIRHTVSYDGQAAIELEALAETTVGDTVIYPFQLSTDTLDFAPLFPAILDDIAASVPAAIIAHRFHLTVAEAAIQACVRIAEETGLKRVVLSGGVFQNRLLTEMIYTGLTTLGLQIFTHCLAPTNDGGIALGQVTIAARQSTPISNKGN